MLNQQTNKGKITINIPSTGKASDVWKYIKHCRPEQEEAATSPLMVVESSVVQYATVNEKVSVVYLPVQYRINSFWGDANDDAFVLQIATHPTGPENKKCLVMPVLQDPYAGISQMRGLTGECVCLGCIAGILHQAENEQKDPIQTVLNQLTKPVAVRMTRMATPGWPAPLKENTNSKGANE